MSKAIQSLVWATYGRGVEMAYDKANGLLLMRVKVDDATIAGAKMGTGTPDKPAKNKILGTTGGITKIGNVKVGLNVMIAPGETSAE